MNWKKLDSLKLYIRDIGRFPLLSREEEIVLGRKACKGDEVAVRRLVESNLRLVIKIARDFTGLGVSLKDLIAEGNIGLIRAANKFNPDRGAKFSSYSAIWIKQAIRIGLANLGRTVRVPLSSLSKLCRIHTATLKLSEKLKRDPTDRELSDYLNYSVTTVKNLRKVKLNNWSLNTKVKNESGDIDYIDMVSDVEWESPAEGMTHSEEMAIMKKYWHRLNDREKFVLTRRFDLDGGGVRTLQELSNLMKLTKEGVRQIQERSLSKIKKFIDKDELFT